MPELYDLSQNNTSFSNGDMMGGFYTVGATTWTISALVAQTAGVPLKVPLDLNAYGKEGDFLLGGYSLGEILDQQGYNQTFLIGSNANFGGRRTYFTKHGNYNIYDYYTAMQKGKISKDYLVWWGYEDKKLYSNAKEELSRLASLDEPFNLTMLTTETHHPSGYFDSSICENKHDDQFMNSISCTSQQLYSFIKWIQKQDFYSNTTIVIAGDHLSMNTDYFKDIEDYERTVFNLFINSSVSTENTKNRLFSSMDMYPTTLASLGVEIDGNKLGLGTNLFSNEKTLLEKYGVHEVNDLLNKKSNFYDNNILYNN
jgi:phosphoglycerol transferase